MKLYEQIREIVKKDNLNDFVEIEEAHFESLCVPMIIVEGLCNNSNQIIRHVLNKAEYSQTNILFHKYVVGKLREYCTSSVSRMVTADKEDIKDIIYLSNKQTFDICRDGDLKRFNEIYFNGSDIFFDQESCLKIACAMGHLDLVKRFAELGSDLSISNNGPMRMACKEGRLEIAKFLDQNGASVIGNNSLDLAAKYNHTDIIAYFLK